MVNIWLDGKVQNEVASLPPQALVYQRSNHWGLLDCVPQEHLAFSAGSDFYG